MTDEIDEIRLKIMDYEGRCNCSNAGSHHPVLGWICGITRYDDRPKTCWEMCGSGECRKHAYKTEREISYTANPLFPNEFVDIIRNYVERVK